MTSTIDELPFGSESELMRPAASLTGGMIKRRTPVRVATPDIAAAEQALPDGPSNAEQSEAAAGAKELTARVEAAFGGTASPKTSSGGKDQRAAEAGELSSEAQALQERQREMRRLAAQRAEVERQGLAGDQQPSTAPGDGRSADAGGRASGPAVADPRPNSASNRARDSRQVSPSEDPAAAAHFLTSGDHAAQKSAPNPAEAARRRSLVPGGMTALERRQAAMERHHKLAGMTDAGAGNGIAAPDIVAYWEGLRNGRQVPEIVDIDPQEVAANWPNSLLINSDSDGDGATLERSFAQVMRQGRERAVAGGGVVVEYTPMVTEWIFSIGREAARAGRPIQDIEVFPTSAGNISYRVTALPLSGERLGAAHALCHISHA